MKKSKIIFASIFGNALEFYDFTLYGSFAFIIAHIFFPPSDPFSSILQSLGVFAVGFLMRPFGAAVFGYIGDKFGRKKALTFSILLMGIPTLIMGIMPSFATVGWFAPIMIILCRLLQGLCTGGEYNGAAIFALEHVGRDYPGLTGGLITGSAGIGALLAMGVSILVCHPCMPEWGWRLAFIAGTLASLWGWYVRIHMAESPAFKRLQSEHKISKSPLKDALLNHKRAAFVTMIFGAFDGVLSYIVFVFLDVFLELHLHYSDMLSKSVTLLSIFIFTLGSPFMGFMLDKFRRTAFLQLCAVIIFLGGLPTFWLLNAGALPTIILASIIFGLMAASIAGAQHAYVQNLFPTKDRYSGIAFSFSFGMSIGGLTPFILTKILEVTQHYAFLALYVMAWSALCFFALHLSQKIKRT